MYPMGTRGLYSPCCDTFQDMVSDVSLCNDRKSTEESPLKTSLYNSTIVQEHRPDRHQV